MNSKSVVNDQTANVEGLDGAACSSSFPRMPIDAALEFADSGESAGGLMTHQALETLASAYRSIAGTTFADRLAYDSYEYTLGHAMERIKTLEARIAELSQENVEVTRGEVEARSQQGG